MKLARQTLPHNRTKDGIESAGSISILPANRPLLTRRGLLQQAGWVMAAYAIPAFARPANPALSSVMSTLSAYMANAVNQALPDEIVATTKLHILDTIAAMVSGSELPPGRAAVRFAQEYGGEKVSTIVATRLLASPIEAAFTNAILAHSDETDDSHAPSQSHPGCAVVPAALAVGEKFIISGSHFVRAVALGYDVGCRVTMTLGGERFQTETHRATHSIAGVFGAAVAAGCAASLNAQQMRWLLDYAAQQCSGIAAWKRDTEHMEKAFAFAGMPARNGTTAALLVSSNWTGVDDVFAGPDNFFLANAPEADPKNMIENLGERYEIARTNIKKWSVGSPIQAPLDAVAKLLSSHRFATNDVTIIRVTLATQAAATVDNRDIPDICLQHMIALMLVDKTVTFRSAHDKSRMQDPAILREKAKVKLIPSEELEHDLPKRVAIVEITLADGTQVRERVEAVRGTNENPMSREEVVDKAKDLILPVLRPERSAKIIERILALEKVPDVRELRLSLQPS